MSNFKNHVRNKLNLKAFLTLTVLKFSFVIFDPNVQRVVPFETLSVINKDIGPCICQTNYMNVVYIVVSRPNMHKKIILAMLVVKLS